jgi:hypothetical protein
MSKATSLTVAVRCRPISEKEISRGATNIIGHMEGKTVQLIDPEKTNDAPKTYTYDFCYNPTITQQIVYKDLGAPIVEQSLDGFNGTIFAYGQTGSGKTFSMMGTAEQKGIIPLLNDDLWGKIGARVVSGSSSDGTTELKIMVTVSFLEVYNETINDLLNPKPNPPKLDIRESAATGIFVQGLTELVSEWF